MSTMRGSSLAYLIRRLAMFALTIWLGLTLMFLIPRMAPGDPIAAMVARISSQAGRVENSEQMIQAWRTRFGLDAPLYQQYGRYLWNSLHFDLGYSMAYFPMKVEDLVRAGMPWTLALLSIATVLSFLVGSTLGALMGWPASPRALRLVLPAALCFTSIPPFMLGILLIYVFAFGLRWFPFAGAYAHEFPPGRNLDFVFSAVHHGILPATAIVVTTMGFWALGMRAMMVTTSGEDYMILAQAKGLRPRRLFWMYGVRNAILPQVTSLALSIGGIAGGSVLVEYIFTYPGMGYLLYQGIVNNDYALIQGMTSILIIGVATAVLIVDLAYPLLDPRIRRGDL